MSGNTFSNHKSRRWKSLFNSQSGTEALLTGVYDKQFADSGSISAYAKSALYWAVYNSYISGTSETTLSPQAQATRAQISKILVNYLENTKA